MYRFFKYCERFLHLEKDDLHLRVMPCARVFFVFFELCVAYANVKERLIVARAYIQRTLFSCARTSCLLCVCFPFCSFKDEKRTRRKKKQVCFSIRRVRIVNVLISF